VPTLSIYYPHLFLFVYNLRENQEDGKVTPQQKSWRVLRDRLNVSPEAEYNLERNYPITVDDLEGILGFYQPYTLGDTDSLLVACCTKEKDQPQNFHYLSDFQQKLEAQGNIGKTWLILGYLNSSSEAAQEKAAKQAYQAFRNTDKEPSLKPGNFFLGGSIFEVWEPPDHGTNLDNNEIVLICICANKKPVERFATFYYELMLIFYYRHKIISNYKRSKSIKQMLVQEKMFQGNSNLGEINVKLSAADEVEKHFDYLQNELQTNFKVLASQIAAIEKIKIELQSLKQNIHNYQKWLELIKIKAQEEIGLTKLKCLENFSEFTANVYQGEIEEDYTILAPELRVREKYIDTIRGLIEIDQAERTHQIEQQNQKFQDTVIFLGTSIGTATFVASSFRPLIIKEITIQTSVLTTKTPVSANINWLSCTIFPILYIVIGLICGWAAHTWWRSLRPPSKD